MWHILSYGLLACVWCLHLGYWCLWCSVIAWALVFAAELVSSFLPVARDAPTCSAGRTKTGGPYKLQKRLKKPSILCRLHFH